MQASVTVKPSSRPVAVAGLRTIFQLVAVLLISLVAGSTFGIWRGYDPAAYSALTFLETHQGAVRGLNVLLPVMGMSAMLFTAILAVLARRNRAALAAYASAMALMAIAAAITRFANQPINAEIMAWTAETMPAQWTHVRDAWWNWHIIRTLVGIGSVVVLILAVFADRRNSG